MDQHDTGDFADGVLRQAEPREDARGLSPIREAFEEDRLEGADRSEALGVVDRGWGFQIAEGGDVFTQAREISGGFGGEGSGGCERGESEDTREVDVHSTGLRRIAVRLALSAGPSTRETATVCGPGVLNVSRPKECE